MFVIKGLAEGVSVCLKEREGKHTYIKPTVCTVLMKLVK